MAQQREGERPTLTSLAARMNYDGKWWDATIVSVSPFEFMAQSAKPPRAGSYIEMRRGGATIIAQVCWSKKQNFGCRARDRIDLERLTNSPVKPMPGKGERRSARRPNSKNWQKGRAPSTQSRADKSRALGRLFEFVSIAAVIAIVAAFMVESIADIVSQPMEQARSAMGSTSD